MTASLRNASLRQLAFLAGGFVALICVALLTLSSLRELSLRHEALKAAEVDVANIAQSLVQHADDSFELADSLIIGLVHRLRIDDDRRGMAFQQIGRGGIAADNLIGPLQQAGEHQAGAWQRDAGFRIDHLLLSPQAADRLADAGVDKAYRGREKASDHAPTWVRLR